MINNLAGGWAYPSEKYDIWGRQMGVLFPTVSGKSSNSMVPNHQPAIYIPLPED